MKYSMMTYSVARQHKPLPDNLMPMILDLAVDMGLDAVDQVTLYDYEPHDLRKMADDRGLHYICYTQPVKFASPDAEQRRAAMDEFRQILDRARILGAPRVMLPTPGSAEVDRDTARKYAIQCLAEAVELGKQANITVTTEHFPQIHSPFIVSDDLEQALQAVPDLRITYDGGNALTGGEDPVYAFTRHHQWIDFAHFKDWTRAEPDTPGARQLLDGNWYRSALIGEGIMDYPSLVKAMIEYDYQGHINLEYESGDEPADQALRRAADYLRNLEQQVSVAK